MKKLDTFNDNEFQSLDLKEKQTIATNYFDTEIADNEFTALDTSTQTSIRDNFINAQIDFDVSDTVDKVVDFVNPPKNYIQDDTVSDPSIHNPTAPNIDGSIPTIKQKPLSIETPDTSFNQDSTSTMDIATFEDNIKPQEDYINPESGDFELAKRVVNRTNELTANAIQGTYNILGNIKSPIEYLGISTDAMDAQSKKRKEWFKDASDKLNDFVYEQNKFKLNKKDKPTHSWEEVKKGFNTGGVFDIDAWQELGNYVGSEGVASSVDMAEMVATLPLYYASRLQESAEKRAKNQNRKEPNATDYLISAPTTIGSILLDRFGLKAMTSDVVQSVGKKALDGKLTEVAKEIGSKMKDGFIKEGVTEGVQNPLEMFGEEVSTKKGLSSVEQYVDNSLAGVVAGAGMGGTLSGATATGSMALNEYSAKKRETQREEYILDTYKRDVLGNGLVATVDDNGYIEFKQSLEVKVKTIQDEFTNFVINNPEVEVPVEAVENINMQEVIVEDAKKQGLNVLNEDGLNAIDIGFKELEAEIGSTEEIALEPKGVEAEPTQVIEPTATKIETAPKNAKNLYEDDSPALQADNIGTYESGKQVEYTTSDGKSSIVTVAPSDNQYNYDRKKVAVINADGVEFAVSPSTLSIVSSAPSIEESQANARGKKKPTPSAIDAKLALNEKLYGYSEDALAQANKKLFDADKSEEARLKKLSTSDIAEEERAYYENKNTPAETQRAYDFLSTNTKKVQSKQGSLTGLEPTGQNALFDTQASEEYITPSWAKEIVSDTTKYSDIITALTDANNGTYTELSDRAMNALHSAGDPHLVKEIIRFDELDGRWDLNEIEIQEQKALYDLLENNLKGVENGTIPRRTSDTTETQGARSETGVSESKTKDNGDVQETTRGGILQGGIQEDGSTEVPSSKQDEITTDVSINDTNYKIYDDGSVLEIKKDGKLTDFKLDKQKEDSIRQGASWTGSTPEYEYSNLSKVYLVSKLSKASYYGSEQKYKNFIDKLESGDLPKNEATTIALNEMATALDVKAKQLNQTREVYKNESELRKYEGLDKDTIKKYEDGTQRRKDSTASRGSDADLQETAKSDKGQTRVTRDSDASDNRQTPKDIIFDSAKVYSTKGVTDEIPSRLISKQIQKDVARYVKQLADRLGYEFALNAKGKKLSYNGVSDNIAEAGGNTTFKLFKPKSDIGIYVSLNYDLDYKSDSNNDAYTLSDGFVGGHLFRTTSKSGVDGNNQFIPTHKLDSKEFIDDIIYEVENRIKREETKNASENKSSTTTDRTSDTAGVPTAKQKTPESKSDKGSDKSVPNSDKRPDRLSDDRSNRNEVPTKDERVDRLPTTSEDKLNEQQTTNADTVLPKPNERLTPTKNYSLVGKESVELTKGQRKKFNASALDIIKKPLEEITEADREILRHYTGEGGLDAVNENSINQHYTNYETVDAMYSALKSTGITMDKVLEPAVGSGNFVGFNPDASWDVVDIDTTNIEVTKRLYPQIKNFYDETYETFAGKNYDLIISNVPFASEQLLMREHAMTIKPAFKAIHNFYFAHSIDKVKDNGVVAFMTSTGTMDGTTTARSLRKYLMDRGDLIGAFRLPEKSQAKNSHTDTMIDIIFIQKRPSGVESRQNDINNLFINVGSREGFAMNEYFIANPEFLLGDEVLIDKDKTKMGKEGWIVRGESNLEKIKLNYEPYKKLKKSKEEKSNFVDLDEARVYAKNNALVMKVVQDTKVFSEITSDSFTLFDKVVTFRDSEQIVMFGTKLKGNNTNKALHLNRIMTLTEDAVNQESKTLLENALSEIESYKEIYEKSPHNDLGLKKFMKANRADVKLKEFMSYFDKDFNPAAIYGEKTRFKNSGDIKIDSSSPLMDRALFYSNFDSIIDTSKSYEFLNSNDIKQLKSESLFVQSGENEIQLGFMYYAGNVYKKLDNLENLNASGNISSAEYKAQYTNLKGIIPKAIPYKSIKVKGGESWIPSVVKDKLLAVQKGELKVNDSVFNGNASHAELYNRYLNKTALAPKLKDESDSENIQRTMDAEEILNVTLVPKVMQYIESVGLSEILTDEYNRFSNFYVRPEMTGVLLRDLPKSFRGKPFKMQGHQAEGAEKIVFNKKGVLAFAPGGGKTITAVVAVKNLLDQSVMKKPLFVVPVNTIAQWEETVKELYPDASVYEFPKVKSGKNKGNAKEWTQLSREEKEQMAFDLANNRYDFTIIGDTMFQKFGLPSDVLSEYVDDLVAQMIKEESATDDASKKDKKEIVSAEQKRKALKVGLRQAYGGEVEFDFAKLGFDGLIADEVQYYKNIGMQGKDVKGGLGATIAIKYSDKAGKSLTTKDIKDGAEPYSATLGSMRSYDFRFKSKYVSQNNNGNNVILLTGTPTPNKPLELYTLLQHLDENILLEYGIEASSDFVDTFYDIENYETTDSIGKIVKREGLGSMKNLEWLGKILDRYVDYKGFESMPDLPRPKQIEVEHYMKLSKAGEVIFGDVQARLIQAIEDGKLLKSGAITADSIEIALVPMGAGRSASIDLRLYDIGTKGKSELTHDELSELIVNDEATIENNKILKTVDLVKNQYKENPDSGQIIFLDRLKVKNPDGTTTSTHQEIREQVLATGLFDETEVVFVNGGEFVNHNTGKVSKGSIKPDMLNKIMDMYNEGKIKVIIGNTSKLGVGVDLNRKTTDIYQLDIPFRPDEIEQRNNRGVRQGNENASVRTHKFFQLGTFDKRSYDIVIAKRGFNDIYGFSDTSDIVYNDGVSKIDNKSMTDPYQAIIDLESDPFVREKLRKQRVIDNAVVDANNLKNIVTKLEADIRIKQGSIVNYENGIKGVESNLQEKNYPEYKAVKDVAEKKAKLEKYISDNQARKVKYENTIQEIRDDIKTIESKLDGRREMQATQLADTKFITDEYTKDGVNVDIALIKAAYTEQQILESEENVSDSGSDSYMQNKMNHSINNNMTQKEKKNQEEADAYARANGFDEAGANYIPTYSSSNMPTRSKDGTIDIGVKTVLLPSIDAPINADSLRVYLKDIIGNRLYEAKIKAKSALGVYKRQDSAIRVKNYSDMEVMAHEMAHYLDFFYKNKTKKSNDSFFRVEILRNKEEVKALSYTTNPKNVIREGFAEFVRLWLTNYNSLELVAPNMVADFEVKLSSDKVLLKKMTLLQEGLHQYFHQGSHATLRSKQGGELNKTAKKLQRSQAEIAKNFRQATIDKIHSIKRIEAEVLGDNASDAIDSPYKLLQLVNGASSIMYSAMNIGIPTVQDNGDISYSGKALNDIFAPVTSKGEERVRLFSDYLVAKRANELMAQGRENLISKDEIKIGLDLGEMYPEFESVSDEYQEFNDRMLDFYVNMNLITTSQRENFKEFNKNYVPFARVTESVQFGEVAPATIGQRLTGGTRSLGDIMENIINGIESNIKEALISRGKSVFYEMLQESGMGGVYATKVSVEDKLVKSDIQQQAKKIALIMSELGITVSKDGMILSGDITSDNIIDVKEIEANLVQNPEALEFWTHGHKPTSKTAYIDSAIIDDKVVYFEVNDKALVDAMTSFRSANYNELVQGLMTIKNVMTWNITNNPLFYLTNFVRDTISASVLSKNNFKPVLSSIAGAYHFVTKSKTFKEFMASGSGYGTRRTTLGSDIQAMSMLKVNRGLDLVSKLISAMEYGADIFEYGTRVGDFSLAQRSGKSNLQSSYEAREVSTDFAIKGGNDTFSGFMATVPFMKAGINGIDKTARRIFSLNGEMQFSNAIKFKNQLGELQTHKIKIYATGGMIAGLTLALWFQNRDDERYKKLTRDSKLMYWHFFIGDNHIKVPRPYDIGFAFSTIPEIIVDGIYTKHGEQAVKDFLWGSKNMFSVGDISGLFQPILEDMTNTNWTGSPIVPRNMQNLDDLSDQYFSSTPKMYREFGKATGTSPIKLQHYVDGYLGLTAKMIEEVTENLLWNKKEWGARPFERNALEFLTYRFKAREVEPRSKYSEKYYELMKKASGVKASYEKKRKEAFIDKGKDIRAYMSDKEKQAYLSVDKMLKKFNKTLTQIKVSIEVVSYDKSLSKTQKEKLINDAYTNKTTMFKEITESLETELKKLKGE